MFNTHLCCPSHITSILSRFIFRQCFLNLSATITTVLTGFSHVHIKCNSPSYWLFPITMISWLTGHTLPETSKTTANVERLSEQRSRKGIDEKSVLKKGQKQGIIDTNNESSRTSEGRVTTLNRTKRNERKNKTHPNLNPNSRATFLLITKSRYNTLQKRFTTNVKHN